MAWLLPLSLCLSWQFCFRFIKRERVFDWIVKAGKRSMRKLKDNGMMTLAKAALKLHYISEEQFAAMKKDAEKLGELLTFLKATLSPKDVEDLEKQQEWDALSRKEQRRQVLKMMEDKADTTPKR